MCDLNKRFSLDYLISGKNETTTVNIFEPIKSYEDYEQICRELEREYQTKLDHVKKSLKALQNSCKHEHTKYEPDASGNNDSYTWCRDCGKIL